jgi:hypothetical protein
MNKAYSTAGVFETIALAAVQYTGRGHTEAALPARDVRKWIGLMMLPTGHKDVLLGMGGGATYKKGAPLRKDYLIIRVARLLADAAEYRVLCGLYRRAKAPADGAPSTSRQTKSPSKANVKQERDSLKTDLADAKRKLTLTGVLKRNLKLRSRQMRNNLHAAVLRGVNKGKSKLDAQHEDLLSKLKRMCSANSGLKKILRLRSANSNPKLLRSLETKLACLRQDNLKLRITVNKLEGVISDRDAKLASQPKIWVPTRTSGRGGAHDWRFRVLCYKCLVLLVPPKAICEIFTICAHAILGEEYVDTLEMELPRANCVRTLRTELGALNRLLAATTIAQAASINEVAADASPFNGKELCANPFLVDTHAEILEHLQARQLALVFRPRRRAQPDGRGPRRRPRSLARGRGRGRRIG